MNSNFSKECHLRLKQLLLLSEMDIPSLKTAGRLYCQETKVYLLSFSDFMLSALSREVSRLFGVLGEQKELGSWPEILTSLKKVRFELTTLPLPPAEIIGDELIQQLNKILSNCYLSFPEAVEILSKIVKLLEKSKRSKSLLLEWIENECINKKHLRTCLCLIYSKHVQMVENFLKDQGDFSALNLQITAASGLKGFQFYDRIFFCGSIGLFSNSNFRNFEHVWRSPRAACLYFLSCDWIRDNFKPKPAFDVTCNKIPFSMVKSPPCYFSSETVQADEIANEYALDICEIDFSPVGLIPPGSSLTAAGHYEAICDARLLLLEDHSFVYRELEKNFPNR